jgi:hypothetical protein
VRLKTRASDGSIVSRRLDVVRIERAPSTGAPAAATSAPANGSCLLGKLLSLSARNSPLPADFCRADTGTR